MEKKEYNLHCDITHAGSRVRPSLQQQVPLGGHKTGRIGTNKKAQGGLFWASTRAQEGQVMELAESLETRNKGNRLMGSTSATVKE